MIESLIEPSLLKIHNKFKLILLASQLANKIQYNNNKLLKIKIIEKKANLKALLIIKNFKPSINKYFIYE